MAVDCDAPTPHMIEPPPTFNNHMFGRILDSRWAHRLRWQLRAVRAPARAPLVWKRHRGLLTEDVILGEYPKSGATWLAFMLGEVLFQQPIDFESQTVYMPAVGSHTGAPAIPAIGGRLLRTHEPFRAEYRRGIYLVRHLGDVTVSYYHYLAWLGVRPPPFKEFLRELLRGRVDGYGPWPKHVESWARTPPETILVVRYEDLRTATEKTLRRIFDFLRVEASPASLANAIENNTLEGMRAKQERARDTIFRHRNLQADFVRKGIVGDTRAWLDGEDLELVEAIAGPTLRRLGYSVGSPG
jgi:hypothetical protein